MAVDPVSLAINAALIAANMALTASQKFEGPRLDELKVTTADYGAPMTYLYGIRRLDGVSCIWAEPLREVKQRRKTKGGKFNDYTYFGTWAVAVADHEIDAIGRIWFDRNLIYDPISGGPISPLTDIGDITQYISIYLGTDTQDVDPRMAATIDAEQGAGSTPAYRGVAYIVFKDVPLEKLGNRLPQVSVEVITQGQATYPSDARDSVGGDLINGWGLTWSPDRTRMYYAQDADFDIWDVGARSLMVSGTFGGGEWMGVGYEPRPNQRGFGVTRAGSIYLVGRRVFSEEVLLKYPADGIGGAQVIPRADLTVILQFATHCCALIQGPPDRPELQTEVVIVFAADGVEAGWYVFGQGFVADMMITGWEPRSAFLDLDYEIQVVGIRGADELIFGTYGGAIGRAIIMPEANVLKVVAAYHYRNDALSIDQYIVGWKGITKDWLVAVDAATGLIVAQDDTINLDVYFVWQEFQNVEPGAASIWLRNEERSSADLSLIRSYDPNDWGFITGGTYPAVYDRLLHALLIEVGAGFAWLYLDRVAADGVTLRSIVEDVSARCGLAAGEDIDATDLTQIIDGYSWSQGTGKAILEPLLEAYDSEARPHDFEIEFRRRGAAVLNAIPVVDMGAGGAVRYEVATTLDTDLPLKANLTFADLDSDQQPNTAIGQRSGAATDSRRELSLDASTVALEPDAARQMVDGYLRREWIKAQRINLSLTRAYSKLEPGDAYALGLDDVTRNAKLVKLEFGANGVLTTEWERYAVAVHTPTSLAGAPADGLIPAVVTVFGHTKGLVLDIPLVLDAHDAASPIVYLAASPYSDTPWPGAVFYRGGDGITFDTELGAVASTEVATMGYALSALPDAAATVWDMASAVTVQMFDGELVSAAKALVGNGANRALLGDEIIGFTTATLIAPDTYQLSGLIRGRRGTEWATGTHTVGDRFVVLSGLPRALMGASDVGDTIYTRPTTNGGPNGFTQTLDPYTGAALMPYAPAHLQVVDAAGDLVATWKRRTRVGGTWSDSQDVPLGEGSEAYVGQVLDGGGAVIRSFAGLASPTLTYTAAQQASDGSPVGVTLRVMQVSATVGNGFPADVAI